VGAQIQTIEMSDRHFGIGVTQGKSEMAQHSHDRAAAVGSSS
jgi:hypothetical protein